MISNLHMDTLAISIIGIVALVAMVGLALVMIRRQHAKIAAATAQTPQSCHGLDKPGTVRISSHVGGSGLRCAAAFQEPGEV